jgi:hypothetical protein
MPLARRKRVRWTGILAGLTALAFAPVAGEGMLQTTPPPQPPHAIYPTPQAKGLNDDDREQTKQQGYDAANAERKREIADDSAKLLKLATELKAEVDKTNKDTLSVEVIRKADAIEKLARDVKQKMKLATGPG